MQCAAFLYLYVAVFAFTIALYKPNSVFMIPAKLAQMFCSQTGTRLKSQFSAKLSCHIQSKYIQSHLQLGYTSEIVLFAWM